MLWVYKSDKDAPPITQRLALVDCFSILPTSTFKLSKVSISTLVLSNMRLVTFVALSAMSFLSLSAAAPLVENEARQPGRGYDYPRSLEVEKRELYQNINDHFHRSTEIKRGNRMGNPLA